MSFISIIIILFGRLFSKIRRMKITCLLDFIAQVFLFIVFDIWKSREKQKVGAREVKKREKQKMLVKNISGFVVYGQKVDAIQCCNRNRNNINNQQ